MRILESCRQSDVDADEGGKPKERKGEKKGKELSDEGMNGIESD